MDYQDTNLNGWDYALAITEEQVNNGLKIAYNGNYKGPHLPQMPKGVFSINLDGEGHKIFECSFGCPTVHAVRNGLNLCELVIPLVNASVKTHPNPIRFPPYTRLRITTSLASTEVEITGAESNEKTFKSKHHEVFINFKDEKAVYNVNISDGHGHGLSSIISNMLKKRLQRFTGREYRIGGFDVASEADPFVPQLLDFSFVLNEHDPAKNALIICGALDADGPEGENRLVFESKILPEKVPAALWFGNRVVMEKLMLPMVKESLTRPTPAQGVQYDGKKVLLGARLDLGDIQGHRTWMEEFSISPSNGKLTVHTKMTVYKVRNNYDAVADARGHLLFAVSADNTSFTSSSLMDSDNVTLIDHRPLFARIFADIFSFGLAELLIYAIENETRKGVTGASFNSMDAKLKACAAKINAAAKKISALEDLSAGGHLLFDHIAPQESGAVCLGIKRTLAAAA